MVSCHFTPSDWLGYNPPRLATSSEIKWKGPKKLAAAEPAPPNFWSQRLEGVTLSTSPARATTCLVPLAPPDFS